MSQGMDNQPITQRLPQGTTWVERWQSLKAGVMGAIAAALIFGLLLQVNAWVTLQLPQFAGLLTGQSGVAVLVSGAIAKLSGFLFAVTYRYVIRRDQNPHLRSGAVGAFGLVRGLAMVEMSWQQLHPCVLGMLVIESFLLFGGIRLVLDWSFAQGWLSPLQPIAPHTPQPTEALS